MPCFIAGPINITSNEGMIITGNTLNASPTSTSKTASGSGGYITGNFIAVNNVFSSTKTLDPDVIDSNVTEAI